jgi:hypothetical protein
MLVLFLWSIPSLAERYDLRPRLPAVMPVIDHPTILVHMKEVMYEYVYTRKADYRGYRGLYDFVGSSIQTYLFFIHIPFTPSGEELLNFSVDFL